MVTEMEFVPIEEDFCPEEFIFRVLVNCSLIAHAEEERVQGERHHAIKEDHRREVKEEKINSAKTRRNADMTFHDYVPIVYHSTAVSCVLIGVLNQLLSFKARFQSKM